jgi:hypothetical protein
VLPPGCCRESADQEEADLSAEITIRPFAQNDAPQVRELFIVVIGSLVRLTSAVPLKRTSSVHWLRRLTELPLITKSTTAVFG